MYKYIKISIYGILILLKKKKEKKASYGIFILNK